MDRVLSFDTWTSGRGLPARVDLDLFPTRKAARDVIRSAIAAARGPILITGEPGVGKSTVWRSLEAERAPDDRWVAVDASPRMGAAGLYRLIAQALHLPPAPIHRADLLDLLAERALNGERIILVVDEAQNLDPESLEEVRLLSGRIGGDDGFAAVLLVGQTAMARRTLSPEGMGLAARLAARVHLRPLDADEVAQLLRTIRPEHAWSTPLADQIHLLGGGLPARIADLAGQVRSTAPGPIAPPSRIPAPFATPTPRPPAPIEAERGPSWDEPLIGPTKPPIRVEDGLIEVGWDSEQAAEPDDDHDPDDLDFEREPGSGERIDDHYAALQAWQEWATNQGRHPSVAADRAIEDVTTPDEPPSPVEDDPDLRDDPEHEFAPFGRLFTRLSRENHPE